MATIALKIGSGSNYSDGDILHVANRRQTRRVYAEHICLPKRPEDRALVGMDSKGLLPLGGLAQAMCEAVSEFRFERLAAKRMRKTRIATGESVEFEHGIIFEDLGGRRVAMDIATAVQRKRKAPQFPIFGALGSETYYGGRTDFSHAALDVVWAAIEAQTEHRESDSEYEHWPYSERELCATLVVPLDVDVDDATAAELVAPLLDTTDPENPVTLAKRARRVDYMTALDMSESTRAKVRDKTQRKPIPSKHRYALADIVTVKGAS